MIQPTKTITKIAVSPEEMAIYKGVELDGALGKLAAQIQANAFLQWAKTKRIHETWMYIPNKDVYYIPEIVGVMPNLKTFEASYHNTGSLFSVSDAKKKMELMNFGDFVGDFPTEQEAVKCFSDVSRYFRTGSYIQVGGTSQEGVTYTRGSAFFCFNVCQSRHDEYGRGSYGDNGWNIPVHRFNGKDSDAVSLGQTVLYWLVYDLRPNVGKSDTPLGTAYDVLKKCCAYLLPDGDNLILDEAKVKEAILADKAPDWVPKKITGFLAANTVTAGRALAQKMQENLLHIDEQAVALDPYDEKILTDPNRGHWDLWDKEAAEGEKALAVDLRPGFTARNPAADVSDGIVAIDFGTKSTVVVYETDDLQVLPLQVGSGVYRKGLQSKNYENPTVIQFIDLVSFLADYAAKDGRPATRWDDVTVSHNAFQNLKDASSDRHNTFFDGLKQWCGTGGQRLNLQDDKGKIWELPPFMELTDQDLNPLEIYAYYLGRYINHMLRGKIFLHYLMSFPVTYEHRIRECMGDALRRGLRKSFPTALLADEEIMKRFCVREVASEPAAYAITALQEYSFVPEGEEKIYYAVFDCGGGTTDFDFGMFREAEDDRYDYVLTHFGENGDRTLGGENLLQLLAFEVFRANKEYLLNPEESNDGSCGGSHIPFAMAPDTQLFTGHESLIKNSREARQNMRNLMEKLRPVWEAPNGEEAQDIINSGRIQLTLYRENGEKKTDANLKLKIGDVMLDLQNILRRRIEQGIKRFFTSLAEAFDKNAGADSRIAPLSEVNEIFIFLAGNSAKSPIVTELFRVYIGGEGTEEGTEGETTMAAPHSEKPLCAARKLLKFGDAQPMPNFVVLPPLGTQKAEEIRMARRGGAEDSREETMRPTGKTGVAYGLLKCRDGGEIKVETITPDGARVPFQYYIGRRKKGKFRLVIDRSTKLKTWYKFIDAGGAFDILYTDRPEAATGEAPMTIAKQKHITIEAPDKTAFVYIRPAESRVIEYLIAHDEKELAAGGKQKIDPTRIELE